MLVCYAEAGTLNGTNDLSSGDADRLVIHRHFTAFNSDVMNAVELPQSFVQRLFLRRRFEIFNNHLRIDILVQSRFLSRLRHTKRSPAGALPDAVLIAGRGRITDNPSDLLS